jgi:glutathione S-transferase
MPNYKLYYFNGRGRAEISRLILAAAGVKYEDIRINDWPKTKSSNQMF